MLVISNALLILAKHHEGRVAFPVRKRRQIGEQGLRSNRTKSSGARAPWADFRVIEPHYLFFLFIQSLFENTWTRLPSGSANHRPDAVTTYTFSLKFFATSMSGGDGCSRGMGMCMQNVEDTSGWNCKSRYTDSFLRTDFLPGLMGDIFPSLETMKPASCGKSP